MITNLNVNQSADLKLQLGTFYIAVWGCQMNVYDTGRIRDLLTSKGYAEVASPKDASVVILVTCAVRAKAENKVFNQIDAWRHQGDVRDETVVALGGCVGTELGQKILDEDRGVSIVFSPKTIHRLPDLIELYKATSRPVCDVEADSMEIFDSLPLQGRSGASAFVTIMEGCSNKCTYCIVPYTRGEEKSRDVADILNECKDHLKEGARELHLLGQNVNSFCGLNEDGSECSFAELLYEVAALPGVQRIRFTTSNPMDFTQEVVEAIGALPIIADAIHIPVQSGSDTILQRMHRRYTAASYLKLVEDIRKVRPSARISSDFIVGFPGESDAQFEKTMELVRKVKFDQSFSFIYSKRPGTPAADYPDEVSLEEKKQRLYRLQALLEQCAKEYSQEYLHTVQDVLVEGTSSKDESELKARSSANRIVVFKGSKDLVGSMVKVKIVQILPHTLRGELLEN